MPEDPRSSAPGERRLDRPPSERYGREADTAAPQQTGAAPSPARGLGLGSAAAVGGALAITVAGGIVTITAGLLVVAGVVGWAVAIAVVSGAGTTLPIARRAALAAILAIASVGLGQLGLWLVGRGEGGVLAPLDYLGETFGILVPLELLVAALVAWLRAR